MKTVWRGLTERLDRWAIRMACSSVTTRSGDHHQREAEQLLKAPDFFTIPVDHPDLSFRGSRHFSFDSQIKTRWPVNGPPYGSVNVYGILQCSTTNVTFGSTSLTNRGTIFVQSGTMRVGSGVNSGIMNTSFGATQSFVGTFEWQRGGQFTGAGTVRLTRGTFDCGTNDLLVPNLHMASPGMTIQGTNTIRLTDTSWELGDFAGTGEVIATSHLTLPADIPGNRLRTVHGTRRLVNRGKGSFGTNAVVQFLDRSSFRNEGFLELSHNAGIYNLAIAAPQPDVSLLNSGTLINAMNTTSYIWVRFTNSGTVRVNGELQVLDYNNVQTGGETVLNGVLTIPQGYRIDRGLLTGTGVVNGTIRNAGSILPGASPGLLSLQNSLTNTGTVFIDLGYDNLGPTSDLLMVSNHFRFGGSLAFAYSGDSWPPEGTRWEVLKFGSSSGTFSRLDGLDLSGGRVLQPLFSPTNLVLVLSNQPVQKAVLTFSQALPDQLDLRFTGEPDTPYNIEVSSNLVSWTLLFQTRSPDGIIYFRESPTLPRRFYRISRLP